MGSIYVTLLLLALSVALADITYTVIKKIIKVKVKNEINEITVIKKSVFYIFFTILYFLILVYIFSEHTKVNKVTYNNFYIKNKDCNNICFVLHNKNDNYIIKNIPANKLIIKESDSNKFEVLTCIDYSARPINIYNKDYETCKEKGYNEGKNYILYIKEDINNFF